MIRRQRKMSVGHAVREAYKEACDRKLKELYGRLTSYSHDGQKVFLERNRYQIGALRSILRDDGPGRGMDLAVTRLRGVDLASLDIFEINGVDWFFAVTWTPFEIEYYGGYRRKGENDHAMILCPKGYQIWFPARDLGTSNINRMAFLPIVDVRLAHRHMHHYASVGDDYVDGVPALAPARSCWSQFGSPLSSAMQAADLPGVLHLARKFAGRYYEGSPLIGLRRLQDYGVVQ